MKALNLHGVNNLIYEDVPVPVAGEGEVLLKIRACGICSSDEDRVLHTGTYHFPTIPGHEFAGQIVGIGEGVDKKIFREKSKCISASSMQKVYCLQYGRICHVYGL